jgi:hypothetical protein
MASDVLARLFRSFIMEIDLLAIQLQREGYYVHLQGRVASWSCDLRNNVTTPHFTPQGTGTTALAALRAAIADRDAKLKERLELITP